MTNWKKKKHLEDKKEGGRFLNERVVTFGMFKSGINVLSEKDKHWWQFIDELRWSKTMEKGFG